MRDCTVTGYTTLTQSTDDTTGHGIPKAQSPSASTVIAAIDRNDVYTTTAPRVSGSARATTSSTPPPTETTANTAFQVTRWDPLDHGQQPSNNSITTAAATTQNSRDSPHDTSIEQRILPVAIVLGIVAVTGFLVLVFLIVVKKRRIVTDDNVSILEVGGKGKTRESGAEHGMEIPRFELPVDCPTHVLQPVTIVDILSL